ncbi:DUF296 domain-containing protein [Bradyrhizobium yuanmingense]|uniref:PCC domain-containing protein n=1 Tax=Bradyrhizobium yuanmingense TaxID=108015 RepID=UPI0023B8DD06|nr:DUF296 domain-containing protein [Bradyrhizobium yuanmingense]MDF0523245.1 DUF296 domain-containing protein [Bradyrhizobium yuanmingense]
MKKERQSFSGKIEEVIYARLEHGEDLLRALWDICEKHDVKTGVLLDATGTLDTVRLMRPPHQPRKGTDGIDMVQMPGYLEVSAHGLIGMGWVPGPSVQLPPAFMTEIDTGFGAAGFVGHKTPYCHVHITVTNSSETVCGHLMEGSTVCRNSYDGKAEVPTHFSVVIAKVSGVILRANMDMRGMYHDIIPA